jgi:hypothetical protein
MILISPYSRKLRNNKENPKNYPYWKELIELLKEYDNNIVQIGVKGEIPLVLDFRFDMRLEDIKRLVFSSDFWMSVDNFLPHLVNVRKVNKQGIVLWGPSDPLIYGYKSNINILKSRDCLRKDQFGIWEALDFNKDIFMEPEGVISIMRGYGILIKR